MEEDLLFLTGVDEELLRRRPAAELLDPAMPRPAWAARLANAASAAPPLLLAAIAGTALVLLLARASPLQLPLHHCGLVLGGAALVCGGGLAACALCARARTGRAAEGGLARHIQNTEALRTFVTGHELSAAALGRAIRLVQEVELISRGFTVTAKPGPISKIESLTDVRKCARLREGLRRVLNTNLWVMRRATLALLKDYPLSQSTDYPGSYRALADTAQLGICVSEDPEEIAACTGHLSLAYLKALFHAVNEQRSEFLRRLALVFFAECQAFHDQLAHEYDRRDQEEPGRPGDRVISDAPRDRFAVLVRMHAAMPALLGPLSGVAAWSERVLAREMRFQRADGSLFEGLQDHERRAESGARPGASDAAHRDSGARTLELPPHCTAPLDSFAASLSDLSNHVQSVNAALTLCHHELRDLFAQDDEFDAAAKRRKTAPAANEASATDAAHGIERVQITAVPEAQFRRAEAILLKYRTTIPGRISLLQDMFGESILRLEFFLEKLNPGYVPCRGAPALPADATTNPAAGDPSLRSEGGAAWVQDAAEDPAQSKQARSQKFEAFTGRGGGSDSDESESELEGLPEEVRRARLVQMREKRRLKREREQAEEQARRMAMRQAQQFMSELRQVISGIEER
jgi:hypothetical protein